MSDPIQPSPAETAAALRMIADLHLANLGVRARDDRRPWYRRELLAFFGISGGAASVILNGMTDRDVHDVPSPAGDRILRDVYGTVLMIPVRLSYTLPVPAPIEPTTPPPPRIRPAGPSWHTIAEWMRALLHPSTYPARHRALEVAA